MRKQDVIIGAALALVAGFLFFYFGSSYRESAIGLFSRNETLFLMGSGYQVLGGVVAIAGIGLMVWGATLPPDSVLEGIAGLNRNGFFVLIGLVLLGALLLPALLLVWLPWVLRPLNLRKTAVAGPTDAGGGASAP